MFYFKYIYKDLKLLGSWKGHITEISDNQFTTEDRRQNAGLYDAKYSKNNKS